MTALPPPPDDERRRQAALNALDILDTAPEPSFDRITSLARGLSGADTAVVSLIDGDRQWFKSRTGLDACQMPRDQAFCAQAILSDATLWIEDAREDPRFRENPLVTGAPFIRFYAGAPISFDGVRLGTLCVFDPRPQAYDPAFDERLRALAAVVSDELELRRLRQVARISNEIARTTSDGIISADADGRITTWNKAAETIFGHGRGEALGQPLTLIIPHRLRAMHEAGFARVREGGDRRLTGAAIEVPALHKDGREFPIELSLSNWGVGARAGFAAIVRDVSARKQQETVLAEARERAQAADQESQAARHVVDDLVQHAPVPLVMTDRELRVLQVSARWMEHYGMTSGEVVGRTMHDIFPAGREQWGPVYDRALAGEPTGGERAATSQAGAERWFRWEASPWRDAAGAVGGLLLMNVDVTDLARAKEAAARARDAAEASDRTKSTFLANMSHEIRTPLNGVIGVTGALAGTNLDPLQRQMLALIEQSAHGLEAFLTGALELAGVEGARGPAKRDPLDLEALIRSLTDEFAPEAARKGLQFRSGLTGSGPAFVGDAPRLRRILGELIGNAVTFTQAGEVALEAELKPLPGGVRARFTVSDTGAGFSMADKERLFERFQQADNSATRRHGGSGAGLANARASAELLGGTLDAVSEPGRGATFTLTLHLEHQREAAAA